jgi:hypothetical protein
MAIFIDSVLKNGKHCQKMKEKISSRNMAQDTLSYLDFRILILSA